MLRIQLDDRAVFLERWRQLLLDTLTPEAIAADPRRGELRKFVENWGGHAAVDSVGFRAVRAFRHRLDRPAVRRARQSVQEGQTRIFRSPNWTAPRARFGGWFPSGPQHLIDPRYREVGRAAAGRGRRSRVARRPARRREPGRLHLGQIQHDQDSASTEPGRAAAGGWLDMPAAAAWPAIAENMPRIQAPSMGASERMAVSPGHEGDGYLHMPCGQSGNPLSPHYGDAHEAWAEGKPSHSCRARR